MNPSGITTQAEEAYDVLVMWIPVGGEHPERGSGIRGQVQDMCSQEITESL